jgi:RNA polymerase sigma-70 factor (ECF subfamily)
MPSAPDPDAPRDEPPAPSCAQSDATVNAAGDDEYGCAMQSEATRLMTAVQAGDAAAFESLSERLRGRAFQVAKALVGSREDALDLCQEAFIKVFRARETYNPTQPFLPWFHRILRNTCFSFLRKRGRLEQRSLTVQGAHGEELDWDIVDPAPGPTAGLEADERAQLFQAALATLGARDREILALRHFKELSYKEIAVTLEIPEGTVMSRLFHARRRLRESLGPLLGEAASDVASCGEMKKEGAR